MAVFTGVTALLGDSILVPVSEVGSLAVGVGWLTACGAFLARSRPGGPAGAQGGRLLALCGAAVSAAIIAMKVIPAVPGSFTRAEWIAFALWSGLGLLFWLARKKFPLADGTAKIR